MKTFCLITDSWGRWEMDSSPVPMRHPMVKALRKMFIKPGSVASFTCWTNGACVEIRVSDLQINDLGHITGDVEAIRLVYGDIALLSDCVERSCGVRV